MPGLTKCNIVEMASVLNFLYSTTSLSLFKFTIRRKPPSDFSWTNMGQISSLVSCFLSTITDLANKVLISAATNSCSHLLNGYWYNFTAGRLSVSICIPDNVVRISRSNVSSFNCFRWNLRVPPWNDLTLFWRYFLTRSKFFTCNAFWKEISVSLASSWSFSGRCLSLYSCAVDFSCCICCCSSEIGLTFLHSAPYPVSSRVLEEASKFDECCGKGCFFFPSRSALFFSCAFIWFSFFIDSR